MTDSPLAMNDLRRRLNAAREALYQAAVYADSREADLCRYMVWQAKQLLKPIRRPGVRGKSSVRTGGE